MNSQDIQDNSHRNNSSPQEILDKRLATGEIQIDEYLKIKEHISKREASPHDQKVQSGKSSGRFPKWLRGFPIPFLCILFVMTFIGFVVSPDLAAALLGRSLALLVDPVLLIGTAILAWFVPRTIWALVSIAALCFGLHWIIFSMTANSSIGLEQSRPFFDYIFILRILVGFSVFSIIQVGRGIFGSSLFSVGRAQAGELIGPPARFWEGRLR